MSCLSKLGSKTVLKLPMYMVLMQLGGSLNKVVKNLFDTVSD